MDEPEHPPVGDAMRQELLHPVVGDRVEVTADVRIQDLADLPGPDPDCESVERDMRSSSRPESV